MFHCVWRISLGKCFLNKSKLNKKKKLNVLPIFRIHRVDSAKEFVTNQKRKSISHRLVCTTHKPIPSTTHQWNIVALSYLISDVFSPVSIFRLYRVLRLFRMCQNTLCLHWAKFATIFFLPGIAFPVFRESNAKTIRFRAGYSVDRIESTFSNPFFSSVECFGQCFFYYNCSKSPTNRVLLILS